LARNTGLSFPAEALIHLGVGHRLGRQERGFQDINGSAHWILKQTLGIEFDPFHYLTRGLNKAKITGQG